MSFETFFWGEAELAALDSRNFKRNRGGKLDFRNRVLALDHESYPEFHFVVRAVPKKSDCQEIHCIEKLLQAHSSRNHTIPMELVECPDSYLIMMAFLARSDCIYNEPISVLFDFTAQILEGVQFMQEQHIAFIDVAPSNVVYAPHNPIGFGLLRATPGRFYFIDFGSAHLLPTGPGCGLVITDYKTAGGHYEPPEGEDSIDPYAYDVFAVGETVRQICELKKQDGMSVPSALLDYIDLLTAPIPSDRPSIQRAIRLFRVFRFWMLCADWLHKAFTWDMSITLLCEVGDQVVIDRFASGTVAFGINLHTTYYAYVLKYLDQHQQKSRINSSAHRSRRLSMNGRPHRDHLGRIHARITLYVRGRFWVTHGLVKGSCGSSPHDPGPAFCRTVITLLWTLAVWYDYNGTKYTLEAPITVEDEPAFAYRGFSFDTSRNLHSPHAGCDVMGQVSRSTSLSSMMNHNSTQLNVLYWHVIDSQSFPLEVIAFPELSAKGAYSPDEVYTEADVQQIVAYANEHGIDVIMELDSPGHTTAIAAGHPEHVACANKSPWAAYASEPPAGKLPGTMASAGGDEVNLLCWAEDSKTQADLAKFGGTIEQALDGFVRAIQGVIKDLSKVPFIKSDMVLSHNVTVVNDTVVVVWQTSADAAAVAARNLRFIHQPSDFFYLDCGGGEWLGNDVLGNSWCDPFKTWQRAYSFDPLANLTASQYHLVLGGQMPLWSEQSSPENLDSIVWPRLASGAEVFWTGSTLPDGSPRIGTNATSGTRAFARINELRYRLVDRGIRAIALQPKCRSYRVIVTCTSLKPIYMPTVLITQQRLIIWSNAKIELDLEAPG
ncbi:Beta-hexosaminidase 2 [Grifola frondosa]|uniref:beta-N-acetylhexosaminidase n=1 Tax=Grifola frondosa TaxID=5627 RepID=A0A1C7LJX7_GRIFR|nr:Beta-hexosaminidase 2 [Grifola frondosa]